VVQTHQTSTRAHTFILHTHRPYLTVKYYVIVSCILRGGEREFTHCSREQGVTTPPTRHAHSISHSLHSSALYSIIILCCSAVKPNHPPMKSRLQFSVFLSDFASGKLDHRHILNRIFSFYGISDALTVVKFLCV